MFGADDGLHPLVSGFMVFIVGSLAVVAVSDVEDTLETSATFGIIVLRMLVASAFAPSVYIDHVMYPSRVDRWLTALEGRVSAFKHLNSKKL